MNSGTARRGASSRCVVVGAGVVGATSAWRLAQAGADVALVDAGQTYGRGASTASFAHVNASYEGYWGYVELRRAGVDGYHRLRQQPGRAPWWHPTGYLRVHLAGAAVDCHDRHLARLREIGYPAATLDAAPSTVEPALADLDVERTYHFPSEGHVDAPAMVADLHERAVALGVALHRDDPVTGIDTAGEACVVHLRSGAVLTCDEVVVCCGRWTDDVLAAAGLDTDYVAPTDGDGTPVPGLLVVASATAGGVGRVVAVEDVNYRPFHGGRTMVWSGEVDRRLRAGGGEHADRRLVEELAEDLLASAAMHVPALASSVVDEALVSVRAMPRDGLPIVGRPAGADGLYVVLAHAAITLAPALAEAVVTEVAEGRQDARLDAFRPDRRRTGTRT